MDEELIQAHGELEKLMPYLHLPVQSGSDSILAAMNRGHTSDHYRALVDKIRSSRPDIALSSDFIVGFPGESDADFQATLTLIEDVSYAQAFSFKYSPRPGTPGATMPGAIEEDVKSERLAELQSLLAKQQKSFNDDCRGKKMSVLFEKSGRHAGQIVGRSPYLQAVYVSGPTSLIGQIGQVKVTEIKPNSLAADLLDSPQNEWPGQRPETSVNG
jgi:tRNA-2-methylthio-N6-dimethylallyladenosine synthase